MGPDPRSRLITFFEQNAQNRFDIAFEAYSGARLLAFQRLPLWLGQFRPNKPDTLKQDLTRLSFLLANRRRTIHSNQFRSLYPWRGHRRFLPLRRGNFFACPPGGRFAWLRVTGTQRQPHEREFGQLRGHSALLHDSPEHLLDPSLQVFAPPAHYAVALGIGAVFHRRRQRGLLRRRRPWRAPR
ncbi:hypothetical protein A8M32_01885 [Sinorhizobium alkalisoli]|uniref:Uncharacterized protein n=1 Tax=Sinorhizobium alkalisoli TaxID=1752398 RepID=A0A1E3VHK5_9HYPH|nr:hypothetical protein A8M32_01885 [Sinorhizobium alkalisoli]